MNKIDLTGKKFGRWTVIVKSENVGKNTAWICKCECGTIRSVLTYNLQSGKSKSCGCLQKETTSEIKKIHGQTNTRLYRIYKGIKSRCCNKNNPAYKYYGGKGIKICQEWQNDFMKFYEWSMQNDYNDTLTIDRIKVNGNYEPNNCRWVNAFEQANNKVTSFYITINNEKHTIAEWSRITKTKSTVLYSKIARLLTQLNVNNEYVEINIISKHKNTF